MQSSGGKPHQSLITDGKFEPTEASVPIETDGCSCLGFTRSETMYRKTNQQDCYLLRCVKWNKIHQVSAVFFVKCGYAFPFFSLKK